MKPEADDYALVSSPPPNYTLRFSIQPKIKITKKFTKIMQLTTLNKDNWKVYGGRIPLVSFFPDSTNLHIVIPFIDSPNHSINPSKGLEINKMSQVEINVIGSEATVKVNGILVGQSTLGKRLQLKDAKMYIGGIPSPGPDDDNIADAIISDIYYGPAGTEILKQTSWVFASMPPLSHDSSKLGVPTFGSKAIFKEKISDLTITSNIPRLNGSNLKGNI